MHDNRHFQKEVTGQVRSLQQRIGANIHSYRVKRKITLEKLARLSGLSPEYIDFLEVGKGELNMRHIICVALALRIDAVKLLE